MWVVPHVAIATIKEGGRAPAVLGHSEQGEIMLNSHTCKLDHSPRRRLVYFWIALACIGIFAWLSTLPPQRVGDGMEYYAMFLAWQDTLRPWMTATSFASYQQLFESNSILGMLPANWLAESFPSLRLGPTADFNHFWFYSFLAALIGKFSHFIGFNVTAHEAFLVLHFLLINASLMVAYYLYGKRGVVVVILMTLFSPMLWFSDKVHTELFTYCLTLMGVMFVFSKRYLLGAFCIALAATQNPSFALIAFIPFLYRFTLQRHERFTIFEVLLVVGTAFAVLAHPAYYFLRFGVLTPQLLAGGATLGGNLSTFYIWIFDPDLGLLPNWPLGILLVVIAIALRTTSKRSDQCDSDKWYYVFVLFFCAVNFYAHSSTTNLNSGATPGLARYSLWYLPAFFSVVYYVTRNYPVRRALAYPLTALVLIIGFYTVVENNPKRHEQYSRPTWLSNAIQIKLPGLYTPPFEVFVERYSGLGEAINVANRRGVLGPDCHKLAVFAGEGRGAVTFPARCQMDVDKLTALANSLPISAVGYFVNLDDAQYQQVLLAVEPIEYTIGASGSGNFVLSSGWYDLEPSGVWSRGNAAKLSLPCNSAQYYFDRKDVGVVLKLSGFGNQAIKITQNGETLFSGRIEAPAEIPVAVKVDQCDTRALDLVIDIANPASPADSGLSNDSRKLGVAFSGFTLAR